MFYLLFFFWSIILNISAKQLPNKIIGFYILLSDDSTTQYTSNSVWQPSLYNYQVSGTNVLWYSFINPQTMKVPYAFSYLSGCKGQTGCPSSSHYSIYSIGGEGYSSSASYWPWLSTSTSAKAMAKTVSTWDTQYNIDGIDIDIEDPAGSSSVIGDNLLVFVNELNALNPNMIITVPGNGYPAVGAASRLISYAFSTSSNLVSNVGIMWYQGLDSLKWYPYYSDPVSKWTNTIITSSVPTTSITVGIEGTAGSINITTMANSIIQYNLKGILVWYASVYDNTNNKAALSYGSGDASTSKSSSWANALNILVGTTTNTPTTTPKPTTSNPTTFKPTTSSSSSTTLKPTTLKPTTLKPTTLKSTTTKPTTAKPTRQPTPSPTVSTRYVYVSQLLNWDDAEYYCEITYNTSLASIYDEEDLSVAADLCATASQGCWIGMTNDTSLLGCLNEYGNCVYQQYDQCLKTTCSNTKTFLCDLLL